MSIKQATVMVGHIAGDPRLTYNDEGVPRFYARVGVDYWRREDDGTFTKTDRTFHDLAIRYKAAEAAMELFRKGDDFIATGGFRKFTDAEGLPREEFQADTLSPNPVLTNLTINRPERTGVDREAAGVDRSQAFERPEQPAQGREPAVLGR